MASILDEYEDSLSRSAVLQPGCPSVGIPHSGKGEGSGDPLGSPSTFGEGAGRVAPRATVLLLDVHPGLGPRFSLGSLGPQLLDGRNLKEQTPRDLGNVIGSF